MRPNRNCDRYRAITLIVAAFALVPLSVADGEEKKVPERSEIETQFKWDTEGVYPGVDAWKTDYEKVESELDKLAALKGTLKDGPEALLQALKLRDDTAAVLEKAWVYAQMLADQDTRVSEHQGMKDQMRSLGVKYGEATSWMEPELTAIPLETIRRWMDENEQLAVFGQFFDDLFRQKKHILSPREEELLAMAGQVRAVPYNAYNLLTNADIEFPTITDADGNVVELSDSAFYIFMRSPDRRVRKEAYEGIVGTYKKYRNTSAALVSGAVQNHIFNVKARGYENCLQASLDAENIPVAVYNNLVEAVNANLPLLHRYQTIRRKTLNLTDGVHAYDLFAPLTTEAELKYDFAEAVDLLRHALAPLGDEYLSVVNNGLESRWVDVYPTKGKRSGAYSDGSYLTAPYLLLNYYGGYDDVSTLVHEMGHSMHSYLTRHAQPYVYGDYTIFCAEVAALTNELLLQEYMLEQITDPQQKLCLLSELLESFRGTVFRQVMFSEFEQRIHEMAEADEPLTADSLGQTYGEIMQRYYGPDYTHDELVDNYWIRIPHFYYNFYVYKYATSYCAASNITRRILAGEPGAVDAYLSFLKGGSSKYPLELLKMARVDMTSPEPVQDAMKLFERMLDETAELLGISTQ